MVVLTEALVKSKTKLERLEEVRSKAVIQASVELLLLFLTWPFQLTLGIGHD